MSIFGKYKLSSSDNLDDYLKSLGVNLVLRNVATAGKPTMEIKQDGDGYTMTTLTSFKTTEIRFKLGEEFVEITWDGRECQSVITLEDANKMVHNQCWNDQQSTIVRDFEDDQMTETLKVGGVECTCVYMKVE